MMLGGFRKALTPCGDKRAQHEEEKLLLFLARIQPMKHNGVKKNFFSTIALPASSHFP